VRGSATILVVDDEPGVRHAVARALRRVGHRVHEAGSGAEGIAIGRLHRDALQVLVTDVEMPSGSGRVVADTLRAEIPGLRVLLMSGHALDGGPYDVMQKPFTVEVLVGRIEALLTESGGAQPS
jgi:DNA-binding response OmpR family regulator